MQTCRSVAVALHPKTLLTINNARHCHTCWPTQATIWAMLTGDPLLPHWLMISGLLCGASVRMHSSPALLRMPLSKPWICARQRPQSSLNLKLGEGKTTRQQGSVSIRG